MADSSNVADLSNESTVSSTPVTAMATRSPTLIADGGSSFPSAGRKLSSRVPAPSGPGAAAMSIRPSMSAPARPTDVPSGVFSAPGSTTGHDGYSDCSWRSKFAAVHASASLSRASISLACCTKRPRRSASADFGAFRQLPSFSFATEKFALGFREPGFLFGLR